jgi:hypothetical protein
VQEPLLAVDQSTPSFMEAGLPLEHADRLSPEFIEPIRSERLLDYLTARAGDGSSYLVPPGSRSVESF